MNLVTGISIEVYWESGVRLTHSELADHVVEVCLQWSVSDTLMSKIPFQIVGDAAAVVHVRLATSKTMRWGFNSRAQDCRCVLTLGNAAASGMTMHVFVHGVRAVPTVGGSFFGTGTLPPPLKTLI